MWYNKIKFLNYYIVIKTLFSNSPAKSTFTPNLLKNSDSVDEYIYIFYIFILYTNIHL
jgi:hypothetical protein